jgi:hypothetical protein
LSIVGPAGPTGPTGPQGPAGISLAYSGWISSTGGIRAGTGFTSRRLGTSAGSYRVTANPTATGVPLVISVSPTVAGITVRVIGYFKDSITNQHIFDVDARNSSGALVDAEFTFVAIPIS